MARFRLFLIALAVWLFILFNLARPDIMLGDTNLTLDFSPLLYVTSVGLALGLLLVPRLGRARFEYILPPTLIAYLVLRLGVISDDILYEPRRTLYLVIAEVVVLLITLVLVRALSLAINTLEKAAEDVIVRPSNLRVLSMTEGEEKINSELFRARRFDRPVAFILIDIMSLPTLRSGPNKRNIETVFQKHYLHSRIGHIVEAALYPTDILTWHNENLFICLPETAASEAMRLARELSIVLGVRLDMKVPMGVAAFPKDGLVYSDLIAAATRTTSVLVEEVLAHSAAEAAAMPVAPAPAESAETTTGKRRTSILPPLEEVMKRAPSYVNGAARKATEAAKPAEPAAPAQPAPSPVYNTRRLMDSYSYMGDTAPNGDKTKTA